jgi:DNA-binding NtrC family response regulator/class 3 adenylate cyclase
MARPLPTPLVHPTDRLLGASPAITALRAQIRHLASFDALGGAAVPTVLLQGETGTGKGLVARILHESSPRAHGPFVEVNCAAIPETLLEAELFGVVAGAFTDAKRSKPGLFGVASGGTLFLDEIDALSLALQGKLLTAIEAKRVRSVGAMAEHPVDVKLMAATHADLRVLVGQGRFRTDLYFRLAVLLLELPPLRARGEDVLILAQQLLRQYSEGHRVPPKRLSRAAEAWLQRYPWPGNVRELSHLMERVTLLVPETMVEAQTLEQLCLPGVSPVTRTEGGPPLVAHAPADEPAQIRQALQQSQGNVAQAANLLGWTRKALRYRMRRYGIASQGRGPGRPPRRIPGSVPEVKAASRHDVGNASAPSGDPPALAPGGEQKIVAVLAVDLVLPEPLDPERMGYDPWTATHRWEQVIEDKVRGFGGLPLQRCGSLFLAAFGVPHALEQLPQRAVHAALAIRRLTVQAKGAVGQEPWPEVRQAIHLGPLLIEEQTRPLRVLTANETLSVPVRLLGRAAPGELLVSPAIERLVAGWYELRVREGPLEDQDLHPIRAYVIVGLNSRRSPLAMYEQRPLSRFVGREGDLALLREFLMQAEEGQGQVVAVIGEPGVGKTRLLYEFIRAHPTHRWRILETSATAYGQTIPYLAIIELLKTYVRLDGRDDAQTIRQLVTDTLLRLDPALLDILPAVLTLLDVPVEDPGWQSLDAGQRRQRMLDATKRLLLRESQVQPLLLIVENLHWIDSETQAFLDSLIESLPAARLFLLVSYRPEYQHGWGNKTFYTQFRLNPLPPEHAEELLQALLGHDPSLQPLKQHLIAWTEGKPFFGEESVWTLVETGGLVGERGAYCAARALPTIQVPATVQAVLAARIDRLPPEDKRLLQMAAVIGKHVPFPLLQTIAEEPGEVIRRSLARLQSGELLFETSLFP